jgi:membrane-associated PAP2 superfamily phosphatase
LYTLFIITHTHYTHFQDSSFSSFMTIIAVTSKYVIIVVRPMLANHAFIHYLLYTSKACKFSLEKYIFLINCLERIMKFLKIIIRTILILQSCQKAQQRRLFQKYSTSVILLCHLKIRIIQSKRHFNKHNKNQCTEYILLRNSRARKQIIINNRCYKISVTNPPIRNLSQQ